LSEAFKLASTDGCATGLRTRSRHGCDFLSASSPSCAGTAAVFNSAFAQCHGSGLLTLRLLFFHSSAVPFLTSPSSRKVFTGLAWTACPSRCVRSLCFHLSVFFVWLIPFFFGNARVVRRVLIHSSNRLPSGNCDSPGSETSPRYLTEFGTVSNRSSSLSPFFACTDSARTLPEELVNSASPFRPFDPLSEELSQPA